MVNTHYDQNRIYKLKRQNSNLTEEEVLAKEKRVNTWRNKIKVFIGIGGEVLTFKEERQLEQIRKKQAKEAQQQQQSSTTNKTDQSIWTVKDKKK